MAKPTYEYTEVEFYYDLKHKDGTLELKSSVYLCNCSNVNAFILDRIESLKLVNCFVFQVAIRSVVKTTEHVIEYSKRGDQIEIL